MMPSEITLEFARVERKSVPLHLSVEKPPAGDLRIVESSLHPERVEISGPARDVGELATVETEALDLSEETAGLVERELGLQLPSEHLSSSSATVKVQIRLAEPEDTRTLMDVPIVVRNTSRPTSIVPEHVDVATRGPKSKIESLELSHGAVYIDATDYVPGVYDIVPAVALPPEFSLVVKLQAVKLTVMEAIPAVETPIPQTPSLPTANAGGEEQ
jgi:YbbR domain-containing protein